MQTDSVLKTYRLNTLFNFCILSEALDDGRSPISENINSDFPSESYKM